MRKVDSFIKEFRRLEGISSVGLARKAMKDFTFSGGTFVPKGTMIVAAIRSIHRDEAFYEDADAFEPFRFADLRDEDGEDSTDLAKRLMCVSPGRFFAATELKSMLARIALTYDVKFADNATRPPALHLATVVMTDLHAEVMFRRRVN